MKKRRSSTAPLLIVAVLLLLAAIGLLGYYLLTSGIFGPVSVAKGSSSLDAIPAPSLTPPVVESVPEVQSQPDQEDTDKDTQSQSGSVTEQDEEAEEYVSPVDWEAVWAVNEDVIAWLYIPGINLSYPIMFDPDDNTYYLTHDAERNSSSAGAIFIEDYNHPDFKDMCTVVYGHRMYDGDMFGTLQANYSSVEDLEKNRYIALYLPDREIIYQVFAGVPFDNSHILYYNDFDNQLSYGEFIDTIYSTSGIDGALDEDLKPQYGDRLLILSTCFWGDRDRRYLILASELDQ